MWDTILVLVVIALAASYALHRFRGSVRNATSGGCGCDGCQGCPKSTPDCPAPKAREVKPLDKD